jgi:DNA-binding beta-propeller fold protein YncE
MPSDGFDDRVPADAPTPGGQEERSRRRRWALLALLLLLLAFVTYVTYYYTQNKRLPIPRVVTDQRSTLAAPQFLYAFSGTARQAMTRPTGIAIIGDRVYVTDFARRSIGVYTRAGAYLSEFSAVSDGAATRLNSPVHIAVAPDQSLWVTDRRLKGIYIFSQEGVFLRKFVPNGDAALKWSPLGIAIGPDGTVYVTDVGDTENHRIMVFSPDGALKASWGATEQVERVGDSLGSFLFPNGIAVTGTGAQTEVLVADGNNRRVQVFRPDGTFVRLINTSGTPRGVWVDDEQRLYVVDALAHRVDIYSKQGQPLVAFGEGGVGPGQFNFPNDVTMDDSGRIFVTDRDNNQVQVWGFAAAEIPGVTQVSANNWWVCLLPLPLLLLPLLLRRRRFVATSDFVETMITAELVHEMARGRWRWVVPEEDAPLYAGRVVDGVALQDLLHAEPYSATDARQLADRLKIEIERAGVLAMARRTKVLCTQDAELARLAVLLKIDAYDRDAWVRHFVKDPGRRQVDPRP